MMLPAGDALEEDGAEEVGIWRTKRGGIGGILTFESMASLVQDDPNRRFRER